MTKYIPAELRRLVFERARNCCEYYLRITGLTPIGRATVETMQLNRDGLVNMRRVLYAIGEHPPQETE